MKTHRNSHLLVTSLFSLLVIHAMAQSANDEEFQRLAKNITSPAASAAAFVGSVEKQLQASGRSMSAACRTELQTLMTKASVERLEKTGMLPRYAQMLRQHFNAAEARAISTFLESALGPRLITLAGQASSPQAQQELIDSYSAEERRLAVEFLQSSAGQIFQHSRVSLAEAQARIDAEFEKETMEVLSRYGDQINAIMHKHGY